MTFKDCKNAGSCGKTLCLPEFCHQFDPKQKTNAENIRSMSDEELTENLYCFTDIDCKIPYCQNLAECEKLLDTEDGIPAEKCKRCLLEWLQQPAEEVHYE